MACKRMLPREKRRKVLAERYWEKRVALKRIANNRNNVYSMNEVLEAQQQLQRLPRDSHPERQRHRCNVCGRPHGVVTKFMLCRLCLREFGMRQGIIPGLVMASW